MAATCFFCSEYLAPNHANTRRIVLRSPRSLAGVIVPIGR
jgi:hypothetical protein